jgi:RNA polymerase sigma-70 factor (ECF subfamily)
MRRVAERDRAAFAELYQKTSRKLYGIVLRILRRRDVAEEVLQEVYVQVWDRAALYDATRASPIGWMTVIARNRALGEVRRKRPVSLDDAPEALQIAVDGGDPLDLLEQSEALQRLRQCLDRLEPDRREMVLAAYYEGLSREQLGLRLGRPVGTIKSWLHRSLLQLRDCLSQ